ncbi:MAG: ATP-binding protein [Thermodesulfobacteriota bacterium]
MPPLPPSPRPGLNGEWQQLFHAIQDPVMVVRPDGIIIEANPATLRAAGKKRSDVIGQGICKIIHGGRWPHIECPLEQFLTTCRPKVEETRLPGLGGEYILTVTPVKDNDGTISRLMLIARELSVDERRKEDSMRTAQLAALGELAAGVAHEVNNPINGIINFAQILLDDAGHDSTEAELLEKIVLEGERIAAIIHNLLSFAREGNDDRELVSLAAVARQSLALVAHQLSNDGIEVEVSLPEEGLNIQANFRQLQQVILNILSNSRYALNERFPGQDRQKKIEIKGAAMAGEESFCRLVIKDFGTGIPQSLLERLFEPFFTTKAAGLGTGLGLSISYGIVKKFGGEMHLNSRLNQYTEVIIDFPQAAIETKKK